MWVVAVVAAWTYCWSCWEGEETRPSKQPRRWRRGEKKEEEGKDWNALVGPGAVVVVVAVAGVRLASRLQTTKRWRTKAKEAEEEDKTQSRGAPPRVIGRGVSLSLGGRRRPVYVCMCGRVDVFEREELENDSTSTCHI